MATPATKTQCVTCGKEKATSRCVGCLQDFCFNHLAEHRQQLNKQVDDIQVQRDSVLQTINEQTTNNSQKHLFIQQIDQWEHESIQKIKQTAEEIRQIVLIHTNDNLGSTKDKLNKLTEQLRDSREKDDIMETDLQKWEEELQLIKEQLNRPSTPNIIIQQSSTPLINKLQVEFSGK
jgi:chromosome segregation ATPase